jgi:L,D-peptidoglycan transpeptidase YkuD (ErfK/YbiS/YcfS/YnhG family)
MVDDRGNQGLISARSSRQKEPIDTPSLLMALFRNTAIVSAIFVFTVGGATPLAQDVKAPTDFAGKAAFPEGAARAGPPALPTTISPPSEVRARPRSAQEVCAALSAESTLYCASSVLAPQAGNNYGVSNLFDQDATTAWVAGRTRQPIGEWIVVDLGGEKLVKSIDLHNGYQKSADAFSNNSRIRRLKVVFSEGSNIVLTLEDRLGAQHFPLRIPTETSWVQLVIEDVYPGKKYADTGISELHIEAERRGGNMTAPAAPARTLTPTTVVPADEGQPVSLKLSGTRLSWSSGTTRAAVGRSGVRADKREGDGATPTGTFPLLFGLYRADRVIPPASNLPMKPLQRADAWVDDPADPKYNQLVSAPYPARVEKLWREDELYDVLIVIGYNINPTVPGAGSAIFLHIARPNFSGTEGCVAVSREALLQLVALIGPSSTITITP